MSQFDDDVDDMGPLADLLSDDAVEAFLSGGPGAWEQDAALVAVDRQLAAAADGPAPAVGPALARLMAPSPAATHLAVAPRGRPAGSPAFARPARRHRRRLVAVVAGGMAAAASALPVAAATNVLPEPVHQAVVRVVEAVTPFEFPTRVPEVPGGPASTPPVTAPPALSSTPPSSAGAEGNPAPASPAAGAPGLSGDLPQGPPASLPATAPQPGTRPTTPATPGPPTTGPRAGPDVGPPVTGPAPSAPVPVIPGQPPVTTPAPAAAGPASEAPAAGPAAPANTRLRS